MGTSAIANHSLSTHEYSHKTDPKTNSKLLSANLSNQIIYFKTITMPEKWDEEEDSSTPPSSQPQAAVSTRRKFDDEEDDSDVLDSWDAAEDSEVEREKAKVAAERKAKADAEVAANKKAQYVIFLQEFTKQLAKDLPSDQIKKIASTLTALSNEKMKEEKNAEKGGKKSKAQKTKVALVASRNVSAVADTQAYDDDFGDDDFM